MFATAAFVQMNVTMKSSAPSGMAVVLEHEALEDDQGTRSATEPVVWQTVVEVTCCRSRIRCQSPPEPAQASQRE